MPNTYAVTPEDVAAELRGVFKDGFSQVSNPKLDQVVSFIADADAIVTLHLTSALGTAPTPSDANARLAVRYILDAVKAQVIRVVFTGNAPQVVRDATQPYDDLAQQMLERIDALEGAETNRDAVGGFAMPSGTTCHILSW